MRKSLLKDIISLFLVSHSWGVSVEQAPKQEKGRGNNKDEENGRGEQRNSKDALCRRLFDFLV
jgi:hypothetical protein